MCLCVSVKLSRTPNDTEGVGLKSTESGFIISLKQLKSTMSVSKGTELYFYTSKAIKTVRLIQGKANT